jgi:glycosyltransferase involved in cell wall biosynthesis
MIKKLCINGSVSLLGGADIELFHQISVWQALGIEVHNIHTGVLHGYLLELKKHLEEQGVIYHPSKEWQHCKGMHVISYCNGSFLTNLHIIKNYCKASLWLNCMTFVFKKEIECQRMGLIDFHIYQTQHQKEMIGKHLVRCSRYPYRTFVHTPYFDPKPFTFYHNRPTDKFRFGRISRADPAKYHKQQFEIYDKIQSPVPKEGIVMGWNEKTANYCGFKDSPLPYVKILKEMGITQQEFYKHTDVLIQQANTFENLPRVGMEAMASGSVLVVDNRGGWKQEVEDGKTGFLCNTTEDFIEKSTFLAHHPEVREQMRFSALNKLMNTWGFEKAKESWTKIFNEVEKLYGE